MPDDLKPNEAIKPLAISIATIFDTVKTIIALGHEAEFLQLSKDKNFTIVVGHDIINAVKNFLLDRYAHKGVTAANLVARDVIISPNGRCP